MRLGARLAACAPALCFAGPMALVLAFLFAPTDVAAAAGADMGQIRAWAIVSVLALLACSALCLGGVLRLRKGVLVRVCLGLALVLPAAGVALGIATPASGIAVAANALLLPAAVAQLYLCAVACAGMRASDAALGTGAALVAALAVDVAVVQLTDSSAASAVGFGCALLACGAGLAVCLRAGRAAHPDDAGEPAPAGTARDALAELRRLRYDWRSLLGCAVCAVLFGSALGTGGMALSGASLAVSFAGRFAGALGLVAALVLRRVRPQLNCLVLVALVAAVCGALAWPVSDADMMSASAHFLSAFSQILFVGLLFVETQLTDRDVSRPGLMVVAGFLAFFATWACGAALGGVVPAHAMASASHILLMACLAVLLVSATRSCDAEASARQATSYADALRDACEGLARAHGLSDREAEVLRMMAAGLSATSIAERLVISPNTVKTYVRRIYAKMGVHSHEELTALLLGAGGEASAEA